MRSFLAIGVPVKPFFGSNYNVLVEAMRFNQTQVAWFSAKPALEAVDRAQGEVIARTVDPEGRDSYTSTLVVKKGSGITLDKVLACLRERPAHVHVVLTGRAAPAELAELVGEAHVVAGGQADGPAVDLDGALQVAGAGAGRPGHLAGRYTGRAHRDTAARPRRHPADDTDPNGAPLPPLVMGLHSVAGFRRHLAQCDPTDRIELRADHAGVETQGKIAWRVGHRVGAAGNANQDVWCTAFRSWIRQRWNRATQ